MVATCPSGVDGTLTHSLTHSLVDPHLSFGCLQALEAARKQLQKREAELAEATAESFTHLLTHPLTHSLTYLLAHPLAICRRWRRPASSCRSGRLSWPRRQQSQRQQQASVSRSRSRQQRAKPASKVGGVGVSGQFTAGSYAVPLGHSSNKIPPCCILFP
jgi:hypothetical protein